MLFSFNFIVVSLTLLAVMMLMSRTLQARQRSQKFLIGLTAIWILPFLFIHRADMLRTAVLYHTLILLSTGLFFVINALLLTTAWPIRGFVQKIWLTLLTLMLALLTLEIGYAHIFVQSDGFDCTLASKLWFAKYWNPINRMGYRDIEHDYDNKEGKKILLVVGDSFAAGHGIENIRDRFSGRLQQDLGPSWDVVTIAQNGWDTTDELSGIRAYPLKPDVVILSYFVNDIERAGGKNGFQNPFFLSPPGPLVRHLLRDSDIIDFLYWRLYRFKDASHMAPQYWNYLKTCYADEPTWILHQHELNAVIQYCAQRHIRLIGLIFPSLIDIPGTRQETAQVAQVFRDHGLAALDLAPLFSGMRPSDLIVNRFDQHPNPALHKKIGEILSHFVTESDRRSPT